MSLLNPILGPILGPILRPISAAVVGFSPATLFAAGEQGAWYDPSDFSTLFQDSAGTTPVTATGQPVGLMKDKSGRGNHASQATATARPLLQQDSGGRYYLAPDGVDDYLFASAVPGSLPLWMLLAVNRAVNTFSCVAATKNTVRFETGSDTKMRTASVSPALNASSGVVATVGQTFIQGGYAQSGQVGSFANTGADVTASGSPASGTAGLYLGSNETTGGLLNGRIYGVVAVCRALTPAERASSIRYLANRSGVTLP